jgi:DNA-binding response OmpR family regulator
MAERTILISDDEPHLISALARAGKKLDLRIVGDTDSHVVERARTEAPDLIVIDVGPRRNGLELLGLLKGSKETQHIPIIVISGKDHPEDRDVALELGAEAFVAKPLGADFLPKVLALLQSRK